MRRGRRRKRIQRGGELTLPFETAFSSRTTANVSGGPPWLDPLSPIAAGQTCFGRRLHQVALAAPGPQRLTCEVRRKEGKGRLVVVYTGCAGREETISGGNTGI